jgi:hypothetical protein
LWHSFGKISHSFAEFELAFHLFLAILEREEVTAAQRSSVVPVLATALSSEPAVHSASKVKLLIALFNLLPPEHGLRATVLLALLNTALVGNQTSQISTRTLHPARLESWHKSFQPAPSASTWSQIMLRLAQFFVAKQEQYET